MLSRGHVVRFTFSRCGNRSRVSANAYLPIDDSLSLNMTVEKFALLQFIIELGAIASTFTPYVSYFNVKLSCKPYPYIWFVPFIVV